MLKDIVNILRDTFLRYKEVRTFKYKDDLLFNAQGNDKPFQVFVDDQSYHRLNITTGIFIAEFNITILKTPSKDEGILDIQDYAYTMACNVLERLDYLDDYIGVLRVHDYSIVTLSHVTDNDSAGVRLTVQLETPNPANLCDDSNWGEPYQEPEDKEITVNEKEIGNLTINKIKLPKTPIKC